MNNMMKKLMLSNTTHSVMLVYLEQLSRWEIFREVSTSPMNSMIRL
jgi:hypothetical protein